jgi:hypothetical protein
MVALKAYLDDSGKSNDPQHTLAAYAGYVGTTDAWTKFDPAWQAVLDRHGVPYLHMRKFAHSLSPYEDWKGNEPRRADFLSDIVSVIEGLGLKHVGHVLNLADLSRFNDEHGLSLEAEPLALYLCLLEFEEFYGGGCAEFIIDRVDKPYSLIGAVHELAKHEMRIEHPVGAHIHLHPIPDFLTFKDVLPIQAADFIAYEALKFSRHKNAAPDTYFGRKSFQELMRISKDRGGYWDYPALVSLHEARGGAWPKTVLGQHAESLRGMIMAIRGAPKE